MKPLDIGVLCVLLAILVGPLVWKWAAAAIKPLAKGPTKPSGVQWQQLWVERLIELQGDLEGRQGADNAVRLCRQLIWELLGGGPQR